MFFTRTRKHRLPQEGDIVRDADGSLAFVSRIGWHDDPSPMYGETVWRAFIIGLNADGSIWTDWALYGDLKVAEAAGEARFCEAVKTSPKAHLFYVTIEATAETTAEAAISA